jgi:hypothetical protein
VKEKNRLYYERKKADILAKKAQRAAAAAAPAAAEPAEAAVAGNEAGAAAGPLEQRRAMPFGNRYAARRANVNANKRDRHANSPQFRAVELYSRRFQRAFAGNKNLQALAGCSLEWFRRWIEHQWRPGMTWENYGTHWCFDHVTPKAAFDFLDEAQARACNDWRNFQPLTRVENSHKRIARDAALEAAQAAKAHAFELANRNQVNHNSLRGNNARD